MPLELQEQLTEMLTAESAQPSELAAAKLIATAQAPVEQLVQSGALCKALASLVRKAQVVLPTLAERAEDLRAVILDVTSRFRKGPDLAPLGIERRALQVLLDYAWPGNDTELQDVVGRAARLCSGPRLDLPDLNAIGFASFEVATRSGLGSVTERGVGPFARLEHDALESLSVARAAQSDAPPSQRPASRRSRAPRRRRRN
jgi:DNA-binding NtrC family response regulator